LKQRRIYPIFQALLAALLFGASAPVAKLLLGEIDPIPLAGLLYFGSGVSCLVVLGVLRLGKRQGKAEAQLQAGDFPWLAGSILAGGIAAPIVLLFSLHNTPAATASLLLNFEGVATALIAVLLFREALSRPAWWAIALITTAGIMLSTNLNGKWGVSPGTVGIIAACIFWGLDNNFTRNISAKDPLTIVTVKGLVAGLFSLVLAILLGRPLPALPSALGAMVVGSLCYGLSIFLFVRAMRGLGAARTSALFGTSPLAGITLSLFLFHDSISLMFIVAIPLIIGGTILLSIEEHRHLHTHEMKIHEHRHRHDDEHHLHEHDSSRLPEMEHSHFHEHTPEAHEHPHMPDIHHRHVHSGKS
jgi:drug/metabolite transporter (DMT)-like permease